MKDIRQTIKYARYLQQIGWEIEKLEGSFIFKINVPLLGTVIKIQRPNKFTPTSLKKLTSKYRVFQIIVEPPFNSKKLINDLRNAGFKISNSPYLPSKTLVINLRISTTQLLKNLKKDARYALRKTRDLPIREEIDIQEFHNAWKKSVNFQRVVTPLGHLKSLKKCFGQDSLFILNAEKTAGAIFLVGNKTGYYWQAFTSPTARKSLIQYKIVWHGILWAKKRGADFFDFEGIYDNRFPKKSWIGFTHFKKSFGGKEILFPPTYTRNFFPIKLDKLITKPVAKIIKWGFFTIAGAVFILSLTNTEQVIAFSHNHPIIAPFVVILWRIVGVIIPPIPGGILALSMIPVFGWFWAYVYGAIGLLLGCTIAFFLARFYGPPLVSQFIPLKKIESLEKHISEDTKFFAFLLIRFTTGPILDFVSYIAGLTKISFWKFFAATAISILPDALYYYFGDAIYRRGAPSLVLSILLLIGLFYLLKKLNVFSRNSTKD